MSPPPESTTTGGATCGFEQLYGAFPPLAPSSTTGGATFGYAERCAARTLMHAVHASKGRREAWVNPAAAMRSLPRTARPSRAGRLVTAGRARQGRRSASRAGPDDPDGDPAPDLADGAAGGRS